MVELMPHSYFAGYELDSKVFSQDPSWMKVFGIHEFNPNLIFPQILEWVDQIHHEAEIPDYIGTSIHFKKCNGYLVNSTFRQQFLDAAHKSRTLMRSFCHLPYREDQLPLGSEFHNTLIHQMKLCENLQSSGIILHPPLIYSDKSLDFVKEFLNPSILDFVERTQLTLFIENAQESGSYYQSFKNLINFRNILKEELNRINRGSLIAHFQFCFDTGHYLLFQQRDGNGNQDFEHYSQDFFANVGIFHIHSNDGSKDQHMLPYSSEEPPEKNLPFNFKSFFENCHLIMKWLEECNKIWNVTERTFILEVNPLFTRDELISFWHKLGNKLGLIKN